MTGTPCAFSAEKYSAPALPSTGGSVFDPTTEPDRQPSGSVAWTAARFSRPAAVDSVSLRIVAAVPLHPSNTFNDYPTSWIEPWNLFPDTTDTEQRIHAVRQAYTRRIEELRSDGAMEDLPINEASERDFRSFVISSFELKKAGLVLLDNGNLRAIWKGDDGSQLGLQFLGGRMVEYVFFVRRPAAREMSRGAGLDTLDALKEQIRRWNLSSMVSS